ncbi:IS5/IS1182 family transposase, partial [Streptomyces sp. NPDC059814]
AQYPQRNTAQRSNTRLKQWRGRPMRTENHAIAYPAALHLAAILIWARR